MAPPFSLAPTLALLLLVLAALDQTSMCNTTTVAPLPPAVMALDWCSKIVLYSQSGHSVIHTAFSQLPVRSMPNGCLQQGKGSVLASADAAAPPPPSPCMQALQLAKLKARAEGSLAHYNRKHTLRADREALTEAV